MKRLLISIFLCMGILNAGLIDGVALTVNNDAVTLYDIDKKMTQTGATKKQAVSMIIDELLYQQELEKHNITASVLDVNAYLEKLAAQNGMDLYTFKSIVKQKYSDYEAFEEETKKRILQEKLVQKLVRGNIKVANVEDLQLYYDNHQAEFKTASTFHVKEYSSKNRDALIQISKNPMLKSDEIKIKDLTLHHNSLNGQIKFLLNNTKTNSFSPIFTANQHYVTLFVAKKEGEAIQSFEEVQSKIFNIVMGQREQKFLKEYFEKLKLTADIKVVR